MKAEEGKPIFVFVIFLNRNISCVFVVLLAYIHLLFELHIFVEPTSVVF